MSHPDQEELATAIIQPHFDAVRDTFIDYEPEPGFTFDKLKRTKMVVDGDVHDTERHFAMCRDDGLLIRVAPEAIELPWEQLVAILLHEFGHASDFAYPGKWVAPTGDGPATWIGDRSDKPARKYRRLWEERNNDQVEHAADAIAFAVTGMKIQYCGSCMLQCFDGGSSRPRGLK